ncbi:hypothetical protein ISN44_As11g012640 [Arabidopsis suecica]|uniref:Uncharacterized protein n=1 Tax=Arabidopsis suecica TaxID=45249 RepID=A0A8T1Z7W5_ARASU|nr:hypothetical protein ISN44_As11g012640 [Arabidopsis suecica]
MKMKKKGKVYPSPPPPSSSSSSSANHLNEDDDDSLSVLKLLPATILVLVSVLSAEEREVLAYLITRGTTISDRGNSSSKNNKTKKKSNNKSTKNHKPPVFDCECFDCYTNYWFRWDSSPNRELIHEIIEAFENHHLTSGEQNSASRNKSKRGKKKEKPGRRVTDSDNNNKPGIRVSDDDDKDSKPVVEPMTETTVSESSHVSSPDRLSEAEVAEGEPEDEIVEEEEEEEEELAVVVFPAAARSSVSGHKGLARKVLPDVLGLFNSNFWRLWNPNA